jgi:hypothetical protein
VSRIAIETVLKAIEDMSLVDLQKYPDLEKSVPLLYEALQIQDVCDHIFVNGFCVCGMEETLIKK